MDEHSLVHKVEAWLETQGYPLEMRVAAAFSEAGFQVSQSTYYNDPQEGTPREIDIIASVSVDASESLLSITFAIECKQSIKKPWVLFSSHIQQANERWHLMHRIGSGMGNQFLQRVSRRQAIRDLALFSRTSSPAYGVTQALGGNADIAYAAVMSAAKAARFQAKTFAEMFEDTDPSSAIAFPVVVLDGLLFDYHLQADGTRVLREVDRGVLYWRHPGAGSHLTVVDVVTEAGLPAFVQSAKEGSAALLGSRTEIEQIEDVWRKKHAQTD